VSSGGKGWEIRENWSKMQTKLPDRKLTLMPPLLPETPEDVKPGKTSG